MRTIEYVATDATYLELADRLERELRRARPGTRVASEHELATDFSVSRMTARAALQELERRYLVRRQRGAGTFVHRRIDYAIGPALPPSATEMFARAGVTATQHRLSVRSRLASKAERADLSLADDSEHDDERVVAVNRVTLIDDPTMGEVVVSRPTVVVRATMAPDVADLLADGGSLYAVLRDHYGLQPVRRWSRASLEVPSAAVASELDLEGRPPTWLLEGVTADARTGEPIELTRAWTRADLVRVVYEFGAASPAGSEPIEGDPIIEAVPCSTS